MYVDSTCLNNKAARMEGHGKYSYLVVLVHKTECYCLKKTHLCPSSTAISSAFLPLASLREISALFDKRSFTMSVCPDWEAKWSGVTWREMTAKWMNRQISSNSIESFHWLTLALSIGSIGASYSSRILALLVHPCDAAQSNGVHAYKFLKKDYTLRK